MMANPRGYATYKPHADARITIDQTATILSQNFEFLPLSLRQIFYLGVSQFGWAKREKFYGSLSTKLARARRGGLIAFEDMRDDGFTEESPVLWSSDEHLIQSFKHMAYQFRLDPMLTQPRDVIVWTEGAGLLPMVSGFVDRYGIRVVTSGGMDGLTSKKQFADAYLGRPAIVLHVGDYDPSGLVMFRALEEDVQAFGAQVEFRRIAVTPSQIDNLGLPTKPPKVAGNTHAKSFDDNRTVELEAIPPAELREIITGAVEDVMDLDALIDSEAESAVRRAELIEKLGVL